MLYHKLGSALILTFDVNRKCALDMPYSETPSTDNEQVNCKQFWDNNDKKCIDRNTRFNPSLGCWAPFIPEKVEKGE